MISHEQPHHGPSHERWLISYADFITLLFAVFVVLYTSASTSKDSARKVSAAVVDALKKGSISFVSRSRAAAAEKNQVIPQEGIRQTNEAMAELLPSIEVLSKEFKEEIAKGKIDVRLEPRGLVISLRQAAFFPSGQAVLNPEAYVVVDKIAAIIQSVPNPVHLEGHTDAVPISNSRFASNWELSAARSIAMLDLLTTRNQIPRSRLSIAGYADTQPLESNDDPEGRAHNRRVDVVILNQLVTQPAGSGAASK